MELDSIQNLHYTFVTKDGKEQLLLKKTTVTVINREGDEYVINEASFKESSYIEQITSSFILELDSTWNVNYLGEFESRITIDCKYRNSNQVLFSFGWKLWRIWSGYRVVFYQPTDEELENGIAFYIAYNANVIMQLASYLYLHVENMSWQYLDDNKKYYDWYMDEYSGLFAEGYNPMLLVRNRILATIGTNIYFYDPRDINKIGVRRVPWESYDYSNIVKYRD